MSKKIKTINSILLEETQEYFDMYGCSEKLIKEFFDKKISFEKRQEKAIEIIEDAMKTHGKSEIKYQIDELARVELGIRTLQPWVRDHVVHAVLSFILGIYLNEKFMNYHVKFFQWKLTGLLHDVGYPIEIAKDVINPVNDIMNKHKKNLNLKRADISFEIKPKNIEILQEGNALDMIQNQINKWDLDINVKEEYEKTLSSKKLCHGIMSSLLVLYFIDCLYEKFNPNREKIRIIKNGSNWNQDYFEKDVIPACSSIFIHNLPERCFKNTKIDKEKNPLGFLLKLVDTLQDWERPKKENGKGYKPEKYNIYIKDGELFFEVKNPDRKKKIEQEINSYLIAPDIHII